MKEIPVGIMKTGSVIIKLCVRSLLSAPLGMFLVIAILTWPIRFSSAHGRASTLTFELPDREKYCFFEDITESKEFVFEFQVIRGGKNDVDVTIMSPDNKKLYKQVRKRKGYYEFTSSPGRYEFCFNNQFSTVTHKLVYMELRLAATEPLAVEVGDEKPFVNTQMEESMERIHRASSLVMRHQQGYRRREANGRFMADMLNLRVQWWSIAEALLLVFLGVGQVVILRLFFTEKRRTTRPEVHGVVQSVPENNIQRPIS